MGRGRGKGRRGEGSTLADFIRRGGVEGVCAYEAWLAEWGGGGRRGGGGK